MLPNVDCFVFVLFYSFVHDDIITMPSCDVIARDVEFVGGRRRLAGSAHSRSCCCPPWWSKRSLTESAAADSAALYEYTYAQRTIAGATGEIAVDKRLRQSPRCLVADRASLPPPLLPPPPPASRDRHADVPLPLSTDDPAWMRLGGVYVERCPHAAVHRPSSSARHLVASPAGMTLGDVAAVQYLARSQPMSAEQCTSVPTSSTELQLCRPVDSETDCATES